MLICYNGKYLRPSIKYKLYISIGDSPGSVGKQS